MEDNFEFEPTLVNGFIDAPGQPKVKELIAAARTYQAASDELYDIRRRQGDGSRDQSHVPGVVMTPDQSRRFAQRSVAALRRALAARVAEDKCRDARGVFRRLLESERQELQKEPLAPEMVYGEYTCSYTTTERQNSRSIRELNYLRGIELLRGGQGDFDRGFSRTRAIGLDTERKVVSALVKESYVP